MREEIAKKSNEIIRLANEITDILNDKENNGLNYKYVASSLWFCHEIRIQAHKLISNNNI